MPRIIQIISHRNSLLGLADDGSLWLRKARRIECKLVFNWVQLDDGKLVRSEPSSSCQGYASSSKAEMTAISPDPFGTQSKSRLFRPNRPTTIGPDGNYYSGD